MGMWEWETDLRAIDDDNGASRRRKEVQNTSSFTSVR